MAAGAGGVGPPTTEVDKVDEIGVAPLATAGAVDADGDGVELEETGCRFGSRAAGSVARDLGRAGAEDKGTPAMGIDTSVANDNVRMMRIDDSEPRSNGPREVDGGAKTNSETGTDGRREIDNRVEMSRKTGGGMTDGLQETDNRAKMSRKTGGGRPGVDEGKEITAADDGRKANQSSGAETTKWIAQRRWRRRRQRGAEMTK